MALLNRVEPIDYLAIGHITVDETAEGPRIGGSVAYAALTAQALGLRAGILTAWGEELPVETLGDLPIVNIGSEASTRFENSYIDGARTQRVTAQAPFIEFHHIPEAWRSAPLVHLAPVAREVSPRLVKYYEDSLICATPQGWLRDWDADGRVYAADWLEADHVLARLDACVLGLEDIGGDLTRIEAMAALCPALVVTQGKTGAILYARGEETHFAPPQVAEIDPTGAGDTFAAAFFAHLHSTGDAQAAARLATQIAAISVTRTGLSGVPTRDEVFDLLAEAV
jgi:sugar/nucleoside kinase (ribokinase family)